MLCQAACSTLKFRKNTKCPFEWTLRVFSSFRNLLKNRGECAGKGFECRKKSLNALDFDVFGEMLKTEVSIRMDTSCFSISIKLTGSVKNALLTLLMFWSWSCPNSPDTLTFLNEVVGFNDIDI